MSKETFVAYPPVYAFVEAFPYFPGPVAVAPVRPKLYGPYGPYTYGPY